MNVLHKGTNWQQHRKTPWTSKKVLSCPIIKPDFVLDNICSQKIEVVSAFAHANKKCDNQAPDEFMLLCFEVRDTLQDSLTTFSLPISIASYNMCKCLKPDSVDFFWFHGGSAKTCNTRLCFHQYEALFSSSPKLLHYAHFLVANLFSENRIILANTLTTYLCFLWPNVCISTLPPS